jgi:hypothetical protein
MNEELEKLRIYEKHLETARNETESARRVAELLWNELNIMTKRYVSRNAPKPPKLPWNAKEQPPPNVQGQTTPTASKP